MSHRMTDIDTLSSARHQKRSLRQPRNVYDRRSDATYEIISNHSAVMKNPPHHKAHILEHMFLYMFFWSDDSQGSQRMGLQIIRPQVWQYRP